MIFEGIIQWFDSLRLKWALKALDVLIKRQDPRIYDPMMNAAKKMANKMAMDYFDSKRVNHCSQCPETGQLIVVDKLYLCLNHARKGERVVVPGQEFKTKLGAVR